jgi:hypothetical protein
VPQPGLSLARRMRPAQRSCSLLNGGGRPRPLDKLLGRALSVPLDRATLDLSLVQDAAEGPDLADQIARELLLRIVRGEKLPSETLAIIRTLRMSDIEALLAGVTRDEAFRPPDYA